MGGGLEHMGAWGTSSLSSSSFVSGAARFLDLFSGVGAVDLVVGFLRVLCFLLLSSEFGPSAAEVQLSALRERLGSGVDMLS